MGDKVAKVDAESNRHLIPVINGASESYGCLVLHLGFNDFSSLDPVGPKFELKL